MVEIPITATNQSVADLMNTTIVQLVQPLAKFSRDKHHHCTDLTLLELEIIDRTDRRASFMNGKL